MKSERNFLKRNFAYTCALIQKLRQETEKCRGIVAEGGMPQRNPFCAKDTNEIHFSQIRMAPRCIKKQARVFSFFFFSFSPLRAFKETAPFILQHVGCLGPFFLLETLRSSSAVTILWCSCFRAHSGRFVSSVPELKFASKTARSAKESTDRTVRRETYL